MLPIFHKRSYENGALKVRFQETGIPSAHKRPQGQGWAMDPEGYSYVTFTRPTDPHFYQGIAIKNGAMYVSTTTSDDDYWSNGLRIGRDGSLKVGVPSGTSQGIQVIGGKLSVAGLTFFAGVADLGDGEVDLTALAADGTATYTRASAATTTNSAGLIIPVASGVPRSWYWPDTLEYGGYLAEGARTNLMPQSEAFSEADWTKDSTTISANAATAPDGALTADKLIVDLGESTTGANANGSVFQSETVSASATWALSIFAKSAEVTGIKFREGVASGTIAVVSLVDGSVTYDAGSAAGMAASAIAYPNGWWRIQLTRTTGGAETSCAVAIKPDIDTGDGSSGVYIWGAQLEQASFASSYIPTTTASVTRNADVLTYVFAGNADATQGTAYAELGTEWATASGASIAIALSDANGRAFYNNSGPSTTISMFDGTTATDKSSLSAMLTASRKRASSWGGSTQSITGDGATVGTGAFDGSMGPGTGNIGIGCIPAGSNQWFGPIKNVAIQSVQLTNIADMTA